MQSNFDHVIYLTTMTTLDRKWDDEEKDVVSLPELIVVISYLSVLSVIGTSGNAIVLYVFSTRKDQLVSTVFILVLAIVDFTTCLVVIPYTIYMEYHDFRIKNDVVCKIYQFLITSNIPFSALIMVAIALDRYLCICHPLIHAMNVQRAKVLIATLGALAAGQGVCVSLIYGVYEVKPETNLTLVPNDCTAIPLECTNHSTATDFNDSYAEIRLEAVAVDDAIELVNTGHCKERDLVISKDFQWYYQKLHTATFPLCLVIVAVLYTLIYRSVLTRRSLRWSQKSQSLALVQSLSTAVVRPGLLVNGTLVTRPRCSDDAVCPATASPPVDATFPSNPLPRPAQKRRSRGDFRAATFRMSGLMRRASRVDTFRLANLKTAAMLFVVTLVFVVTFMPAFLMVLELLPYNIVIFYVYFANNVANPVIYSFMNRNFRSDLGRLFCRQPQLN